MQQVAVLDKQFRERIPAVELDARILELSRQISADYQDKNPVFVVVLNGAFMFAAQLIRHVCLNTEVSFVKLASYHGTSSTGKVHSLIGLSEDLRGRDVILVEDIVDTGLTIKHLMTELEKLSPSDIQVATLLYKPEAYKENYPIKYAGFEVPNEFLVGFGLDYNGYGRNLSSIYTIIE
jgi:hypoxanthine phosphoribosyltransferase